MNDIQITEFDIFHEKNPWVYNALVAKARQWRAANPDRRVGLARLYEQVRYDVYGQSTGVLYRLSNDHRAYYARLIMLQEPDLAGLFPLRPSAADEWIKHRRSA